MLESTIQGLTAELKRFNDLIESGALAGAGGAAAPAEKPKSKGSAKAKSEAKVEEPAAEEPKAAPKSDIDAEKVKKYAGALATKKLTTLKDVKTIIQGTGATDLGSASDEQLSEVYGQLKAIAAAAAEGESEDSL